MDDQEPAGRPGEGEALLDGFPVTVQIPVHWGELDAFGHVNNAVYFRYFETARILYLERCGFMASYDRSRIGAILHSTSCRFRLPLSFPETVLTGARVLDIGEDRFTMGYRIVLPAREAIAAEGSGIVVSFDYAAGRKVPIPEAVRRGIVELEGGEPARVPA